MSPQEAARLTGRPDAATTGTVGAVRLPLDIGHARSVPLGGGVTVGDPPIGCRLDVTHHAEIDAILAAYNARFRPSLHRQQLVEIVRLINENGRGSMAAGGKSHLACTEPHDCTPAARSADTHPGLADGPIPGSRATMERR